MRKLTPNARTEAAGSREVVAVLLTRRGRVGFLRRSALVGHEAGARHCVTGLLDDGREPMRQAMAEVWEETGLDASDVESMPAAPTLSLPDSRDDRPWVVHTVAATCRRTRLSLNWENDDYRWEGDVQQYLASMPVISTRSLEEARDAVTRIYLPHDLAGPADAMNMRLNATNDRRMTLGYLTYQADVELTMPATEDCYHVNLTIAGETRASRSDGGREQTFAHRRGVVLSPVQTNMVRWTPDAEQMILKIPRTSLEAHLSDLLGKPVTQVVTFDFGLDLTSAPGRTLLHSVQFLASELDNPGGLAYLPSAREQLEGYVMTSLLHAGRHQYSDALSGSENERRLGRLAPVIAYIEQHADCEITPEVLARVGCVSVRTLHAAFYEQLGESPMAYVRRIRLSRVRAELLRSDPLCVRVTDIAVRWGCFHQSRFAQQYRDEFNELPSVTRAVVSRRRFDRRPVRSDRTFRVAQRIVHR